MTAITSIRINAFSFGKAVASSFLNGKGHFMEWDRDFFDSEAFLALSEGLVDYDDTRGMSVVNFLERRVKDRLRDAVKKESRVVGNHTIMVRGKGEEIGRVDLETLLKVFEPRDRKIFCLYYIEGESMVKIGQVLGISGGRVNQIIKGRIRKKALEVLNAERDRP